MSDSPAGSAAPALAIRDLTVRFAGSGKPVPVVDGVDLELHAGRTLALVGESGCGKTMTALAAMGLVRGPEAQVGGSVRLDGLELVGLPERRLRRVRGARMSMVFQEPVAALNPVLSIGHQIAGVIRAHRPGVSRSDALERAAALLEDVGIADASTRCRQYPHQWSGGMCQRAMIAMAVANEPRVIIADEPTTALDVTVQAQVLALLRQVVERTGAALLLITHDLGVVAEVADDVAVMYSGRIVETAPVEHVFTDPAHPYTRALLGSVPSVDGPRPLSPIPGQPPSPREVPEGCAFHPRCPRAEGRQRCRLEVPTLAVLPQATERSVACHFPEEEEEPGRPAVPAAAAPTVAAPGAETVLEARDVRVTFRVAGAPLARRSALARAVDGVDLVVAAGRTLGLVGESGCGKTTTAYAVTRLVDADSGTIRFRGADVTAVRGRALRELRGGMQLVFQDPYSSLDPLMRVGDAIAEPLRIHGMSRSEAAARIRDLLAMVGLDAVHAERFPHQFSGGQLQRVGIARALALEPKVLLLDEPVSALDVSVQAQVLLLLDDLQRRLGLAYVLISHDLAVVRHLADEVAVMYLGRIVEQGRPAELFARPRHPYTRALLDAVPRLQVADRRAEVRLLPGETPSAAAIPSGCRFRTRCWRAESRCATEEPALEAGGGGWPVACHFPLEAGEAVSGRVAPAGDRAHP